MRVLAIDLGQRRVGVAVTDGTGRIALPLITLDKQRKLSDRLRRLIRLGEQHQVSRFVVGLPVEMSGREGEAAAAARAFAERLSARSGKPVDLVDERLTTVQAERALRAAGADARTRREVIDQASACVILQAWLEREAARVREP